MPKEGQKIVAPVDVVRDVASILGVSSGDVGTLCTSPQIKPFAKKKPCRVNTVGIITDAQRQNVCYGLSNIPYFSRLYDMVRFMDNDVKESKPNPVNGAKTEYFIHGAPTGSNWKRIADFDGYDHNARPALIAPDHSQEVPLSGDNNKTFDYVYANQPSSDSRMGVADINLREYTTAYNTSTFYLGIAMMSVGTSAAKSYKAIIQSSPVVNLTGTSVTFSLKTSDILAVGTPSVRFFAFLSNTKGTGAIGTIQDTPAASGSVCIPLTWTLSVVPFLFPKPGYTSTLKVTGNAATQWNISLKINNTSQTTSITVKNVVFTLIDQYGERKTVNSTTTGSVTINALASHFFEKQITWNTRLVVAEASYLVNGIPGSDYYAL